MRYTIYVLLFITSTTFGQDSLRRVPVPAWQLSRLVDETKSGRICDSVLRSYIVLTSSQKALLSNQDSLLTELTLSRDTWKFTSEQKDTIIVNRDTQYNLETKQLKKQKFKLILITIGQAVVIVLLVI